MKGVPEDCRPGGDNLHRPPLEARLGRLADRQHGVVSADQLMALGLTRRAVSRRAHAGRLHRKHKGVYAVGRARLTAEGRSMAAVLAYGPRAVLSHRSAAALWGLSADDRPVCDVTVPVRSVHSRPGIVAHASLTLGEDVTEHEGIPCTTVARTLLDLAEVVDRRVLERAIQRAELTRVFDLNAVGAVLARAEGRRGAGALRGVLAELDAGGGLPESEHEERFLALCRAAGLPQPEIAAWLTLPSGEPIKVDYLWRGAGLAVECDGYRFHRGRVAFERDRSRDAQLALLGIEVLRFTWRQVTREPDHVIQVVGRVLSR